MDAARLERLAGAAARRWRADRDHDDLLQEARIAVWQAGDASEALATLIAHRRCIDWLRHRDGKPGHRPEVVLRAAPGVDRCAEVDADPVIALGLTGRIATVAHIIAEGGTRRAAAEAIDRDPAVVSRMLVDLRVVVT